MCVCVSCFVRARVCVSDCLSVTAFVCSFAFVSVRVFCKTEAHSVCVFVCVCAHV